MANKKTVQPLSFRLIDSNGNTVEVWNRNHFTDASVYKVTWALMSDDRVLQEGVLDIRTGPLSTETVEIPFARPVIEPGKEYRIHIRACLKEDCIWAKAGHEVAWDQLELDWYQPVSPVHQPAGQLTYEESADKLQISGSGFAYTFDKVMGQLIQIIYNGKELLKEPMKLNLWRAPQANELDAWNAASAQSGNWKPGFGHSISTEMYSAGIHQLTHQPISFSYKENNGNMHVYITDIQLSSKGEKEKKDLYIEGVQCNGFRNEYEFIISGDGQMQIKHVLSPEGRMPLWLPRVGLSFVLHKDLHHINWYGRGPQENYPDRKTGYPVGIYQSTVDEMYEPYLLPQDYGLRTDNRWVRMTDSNGCGIEFSVNELFNFNAYPYSTDNLTKAMYTYQLQKQDDVTFNLDYATSGVGCTARGVFDSYRAMPMRYERVVRVKVVGRE